MKIWAFRPPKDAAERQLIYDSLKGGKTRFGWSTGGMNDLTLEQNHWTDANRTQMFLLQIQKGDWIVHINVPEHNQCTAVQVTSSYGFDDGIQCPDGRTDFRHCFDVDTTQIVKFGRRHPAIVPTVNLYPRKRQQRIYAIDAFHETLENLREDKIADIPSKTEPILRELTKLIHQYNRSKNLETFLAKVLRQIPGVNEVEEPGQRGGPDHGTDLIIHYGTPPFPSFTIVVQAKSYRGLHKDIGAVADIRKAVVKHQALAGIIVTTADEIDERVEEEISLATDELGVPIELLAAADVARFVVTYAPELLFSELRS